jgi:transposase-like protein
MSKRRSPEAEPPPRGEDRADKADAKNPSPRTERELASPQEMAVMGGTRNLKGLVCPDCGCADFRVKHTYSTNGGILRRRECRHCGRRLTTREEYLAN